MLSIFKRKKKIREEMPPHNALACFVYRISIFALALCLSPGLVSAVTVDTVAELVAAVDDANAGGDKEILVEDGTYTLDSALQIQSDGITARSVSGNRRAVTIQGTGMAYDEHVSHIFLIEADNFTARDMTLSDVYYHAIQMQPFAQSPTLVNLHILDTNEQMIKVAYNTDHPDVHSDNGRVENCRFEYSAGIGPQYYIGGVDAHHAFNWVIRGNTFINIRSPENQVAEHAIHFWSGSQDTLVEKNIIINCDRGIGFGLGSRGHVRGIIRNNMIYHNDASDLGDVGIGLESVIDAQVYNNTLYQEHDYPNAIEYRFSATTGLLIANNLTNRAITQRDSASATCSHNLTTAAADWFSDPAEGDLHLTRAVASVVDQGTAITGFTDDLDGDIRPQGDGYDIGADEYVVSDFGATTYYIRTDGGTPDQCTGLSDSPYPGSGTNQACAWKHPFYALDSSGSWKIQGGDTLVIGSGSYRMGIDAPNTDWCEAAWAYDCHLPPLPSGPAPDTPTRIVGAGWDQGCSDPPELWGAERPWQILSLNGTSNAVVSCLEITDHSGCVEYHSDPSLNCERDTPPFGDWAAGGIYAVNSQNITLSHLNIHGLAHFGIHAGLLSNWTLEHVRITGNGWVGWDGDTTVSAGGSGCTGNMIFDHVTVEWNGCAERYPEETPTGCWGQSAGGYGDGMGLGATGGNWVIEDSIFRYNTSDGLDMLYVRHSPSQIDIKRTKAYGNAGDQIKVNGPTRIENGLMVSNCGFFNEKSFTYDVDHCRAGGSALALNFRQGHQVSVINSTIAGQGDCLCLVECDSGDCDGSETLILQNNILLGYPEFLGSDDACYIWFEPEVFGTPHTDYNVVFNAKIGNVPLSAHDLAQDPLVADSTLAAFDGHLTGNSPAIDSGLTVGSLNGHIPDHDLEGAHRPQGGGVDRGAYEYDFQCPACSGDTVVLDDEIFHAGTTCQCKATTSITIGPDVTVEAGATVTFQAPLIQVEPGFQAKSGALVTMHQE